MSKTDPRSATLATCIAIYRELCTEFTSLLSDPTFREEVLLLLEWERARHEFPVDYADKTSRPIHTVANTKVFRDPTHLRLLKLRRALFNSNAGVDAQLFESILEKVRVKSYLTDRAQTGGYQTNREMRWEAHPDSPQFALRRDCFAVELELVNQLLRFKRFPATITARLKEQDLLPNTSASARCPVTLDPLDFQVLADEAADPRHGRSTYQVGHVNPLKAGAGPEFRHHRANISWITADGNRIQGHLTLKETRQLLLRIASNYEAAQPAASATSS